MICLFGLKDPLRPEIKDAVIKCHAAGINIRMVTGDNIETATAIAIEAGIVKEEDVKRKYVCMTGKQFREECGGLKKLSAEGELLREEVGNKIVFEQVARNL
jgi:magnesium-transporting ATPase (P-type)